MRSQRKNLRGGAATALPAPYFAASLEQPAAAAGRDLLTPIASGLVRNRIGGFVPSVGEPFVAAASQYIAPLALFAGYKLLNRTKRNKKIRRSAKKRSTVRRR